MGGYSKAETLGIKMQMQQKYDDELKRITNMVHTISSSIYFIKFVSIYLFKVKHINTLLDFTENLKV